MNVAIPPYALLTAAQMRAADTQAMVDGTSGELLMGNAGACVVHVIEEHFRSCPVLVVCGVGNNGGDGFVIARMLRQRGWQVTLTLIGNARDISGDAKNAREQWMRTRGNIEPFSPALLSGKKLVVDALFGIGLNRVVQDEAKAAILAINASGLPVISVDIPSGIHADSGAVMGEAIKATHTVTFFRAKPGHTLLPGKAHTGSLHCADIGVSGRGIRPHHFINDPQLWKHAIPSLDAFSHKYTRGHALIIGGGMSSTGAAKLAALSALRTGAGLVSIACPSGALPAYASALMAVMVKPLSDEENIGKLLDEGRITAALIGPGNGITEDTAKKLFALLAKRVACVVDADAITVAAQDPKRFFAAVQAPLILTPHEGEFARLFPKLRGSKTERASEAARLSGAVIVLKGSDTVVAALDGTLIINTNAPPTLATAGSGDVLAGIITGLLAQGMDAFEAACAGVWLHGEAARAFGRGLIADDLPTLVTHAWKNLQL